MKQSLLEIVFSMSNASATGGGSAAQHGDYMKKEDDDYAPLPFTNIERSAVLQECRIFNDVPLKPLECARVLSKLLYVLATSDELLTATEATEVFFNVTKLFQCDHLVLRRLMYVVIKELKASSDDVIIAVNSLAKDMSSTENLFRASAIRVLCTIADAGLLGTLERHLKQSIVDRDPFVASAALVGGIRLQGAQDVVKRWTNEAQEVLNSKTGMVAYHALAFLYYVKRGDKLALNKLVASCTSRSLRSQYGETLLIRIIDEILSTSSTQLPVDVLHEFVEYLETAQRSRSDIVCFEAARTLAAHMPLPGHSLSHTISLLQLFVCSSRPAMRFAALRVLNELANDYPRDVAVANTDMEQSVTEQNRHIATLAITTVLKTGSESSIDRLMKQISTFLNDNTDEYKVAVVEAIRALCLKYPKKYRILLHFLSQVLRDEGGYEYKKAIVDAIIVIIENISEAAETGLASLAEFIEDCEFSQISVKVLYLLGERGPSSYRPARFIRYIYNRVLLENSNVRAAAVHALASFGLNIPKLSRSVYTLLKRCLFDSDDEVRDRAIQCISHLEEKYPALLNADDDDVEAVEGEVYWDKPNSLVEQMFCSSTALANVEHSLLDAVRSQESKVRDVFAETAAFVVKEAQKKQVQIQSTTAANVDSQMSATSAAQKDTASPTKKTRREAMYEQVFSAIDELKGLGKVLYSSKQQELTEAEMEYRVFVVKHLFDSHLLLQFNVTNTLPEYILKNVHVDVAAQGAVELDVAFSLPIKQLSHTEPEVAYVALQLPHGASVDELPIGPISCTLRFEVEDVEGGDEYEDEYAVEDAHIDISDFMGEVPAAMLDGKSGEDAWDALALRVRSVFSQDATYALNHKSLQSALDSVLQLTGLSAMTSTSVDTSKKTFKVRLAGCVHVSGVEEPTDEQLVAADAEVFFDTNEVVHIRLNVCAGSDALGQALFEAIE